MKVLSFGEILWDVYPTEKYIGGASLNFAAHLAKHGEEVYMLSSLGNDDLGTEAKKQLENWKINLKYVSFLNSNETGSCVVTLDENSVPSYNLLDDVAYDYISSDNIDDNFDLLYFGTLALRSEYNFSSLKNLLKNKKFKEIFVDINIRPPFYNAEKVLFALNNASILKISIEELPIVQQLSETFDDDYKDFAKSITQKHKNINCVIITLGSDGAYVYSAKNNSEYSAKANNITVASTVGAGDSFSAAFIHKYMQNNSIDICTDYANKIAAFVVSKYDAVPDYQIKDF